MLKPENSDWWQFIGIQLAQAHNHTRARYIIPCRDIYHACLCVAMGYHTQSGGWSEQVHQWAGLIMGMNKYMEHFGI